MRCAAAWFWPRRATLIASILNSPSDSSSGLSIFTLGTGPAQTFFAYRLVSRLIRHAYGAEIHWKAGLEPGISIVHGTGVVVGRAPMHPPGTGVVAGIGPHALTWHWGHPRWEGPLTLRGVGPQPGG